MEVRVANTSDTSWKFDFVDRWLYEDIRLYLFLFVMEVKWDYVVIGKWWILIYNCTWLVYLYVNLSLMVIIFYCFCSDNFKSSLLGTYLHVWHIFNLLLALFLQHYQPFIVAYYQVWPVRAHPWCLLLLHKAVYILNLTLLLHILDFNFVLSRRFGRLLHHELVINDTFAKLHLELIDCFFRPQIVAFWPICKI